MAVERLKGCDNIVALSQELGVHRRLLYKRREPDQEFNINAIRERCKWQSNRQGICHQSDQLRKPEPSRRIRNLGSFSSIPTSPPHSER
jgi:hypothetical protein